MKLTAIEQGYVAQGYALPAGMTWDDVAAARAKWGADPIFVPIAHTPGACIGWGVPIINGEFLKRPVACPNCEREHLAASGDCLCECGVDFAVPPKRTAYLTDERS